MKSKGTLLDILRGYSIIRRGEEKIYLRHLSVLDYLCLDEFEEISLDKAIRSGIKSESQLLESAASYGAWSEKKTKELERLEWVVKKSEAAVDKIGDKSQKEAFRTTFQKEKEELNALKETRSRIVLFSAEKHAVAARTKKYCELAFFEDKKMKKSIDSNTMNSFEIIAFEKLSSLFDQNNMLRSAYNNYFFDLFIVQQKNPLKLFGKKAKDITLFQSRLMSYANVLLNKMRNALKDIPEEVIADPIKLYLYKEEKEGSKPTKVSEGIGDLKEIMKKKGKITSEDLLT